MVLDVYKKWPRRSSSHFLYPSIRKMFSLSITNWFILSATVLSVFAASPTETTPIPSATIGSCADVCLTNSAKSSGCNSFDPSNFACLCEPTNTFSNSTTTCIQKSCQGADLQETAFIIKQVCAQASSSAVQSASTSTAPGPSSPLGGSAITTDIPESQGSGSSSNSISLLPQSSSFSFTGTGVPTPVPVSSGVSGSGSGTSSSSAGASSTGAALGKASWTGYQSGWSALALTAVGMISGAFCVLVWSGGQL